MKIRKSELKKIILEVLNEADKGIKVILLPNVKDFNAEDFDLDKLKYYKLKQHIGKIGLANVDINNGTWYKNYYNVKFDDGFEINGISSEHLKRIE